MELTGGLPNFIKHINDQSWVINWRSETTSGNRMTMQTTPVGTDFQESVDERTGFFVSLHNRHITVIFFKGQRDSLISAAGTIPDGMDLSINVNSFVVTYNRANDHQMVVYFNGYVIADGQLDPSHASEVIDWSTSDNLYVNRFYQYSPQSPTHYHKVSIFDRVLSSADVS